MKKLHSRLSLFSRKEGQPSASRDSGPTAVRGPASCVRDSAMSDELQIDPPEPGPKLSLSASPPQGEASIPRASAPASTGCLLAPTHGDLSGLVESV